MGHIYAIVVTDEDDLGFDSFVEVVNERMTTGGVGVNWISSPLIPSQAPDDFHVVVLEHGAALDSLDAEGQPRTSIENLRLAVRGADAVLRSLYERVDRSNASGGLEDVLDRWDAWAAQVKDPDDVDPSRDEANRAAATERAPTVGHPGAADWSELVLRVVVDDEHGLPSERRVRAGLLRHRELADVLGIHTSEAADVMANLDRGVPYQDVLGEERLFLLPANAVDGLTQSQPPEVSAAIPPAARGTDDLAAVVQEAFTATLRQREADLAADRLSLLDPDQAWEAYFGPACDQIEDTLAPLHPFRRPQGRA